MKKGERMEVRKKALIGWAKDRRSEYEALLRELVEIPTVSAEPEREDEIRKCARLAVSTIEKAGGRGRIIETDGWPMVAGEFHHSDDAPTVTVYNHLDVQPASKLTEPWTTEPFEMVTRGDRYFGRGTTDDKGPALAALFGIRAAREAGIPINIRLIWELEEEIGSPNFEKALKRHKDELKTDSVVVSDTIWVSRKKPACPAGLRGMQAFELTLETGTTDVHSGTTGGAARNPLGELMKIVSEMHDAETGRVKIKGFYEDVVKLSAKERKDFLESGFSNRDFLRAHKLKSMRTDDELDAMKRLWAMPTFEVHGVVGGYTGPGIKTVIPQKVIVKISCRLVPNQKPKRIAKLIKEWLKERYPDVKVVLENQMEPFSAPIEGPLPDAVRRSMEFAFGSEPVFIREGGSIGAVPTMKKVLECPILFLGLSLPEHGYHAPNENFDWRQASGGMVAFTKYFSELSEL